MMRGSLSAQPSMTARATPVARLLRRVANCAFHRQPLHVYQQQVAASLPGQWVAARQSSAAAARTLAGKNIFQLRAAVETVEAVTAHDSQQESQEQQIMALPTSDESEKLLRIRHSVSAAACIHSSQQQLHFKALHVSRQSRT